MFDHFTIFTKAGIVLYSKSFLKLVGSPVEKIINTIFLEGKESENVYHYNQYAMKWTMANDLGLIFVVVYQKILQILFMNDLLDKVKERFIEKYRNEIPDFEDDFMEIFKSFTTSRSKLRNAPKPFDISKKKSRNQNNSDTSQSPKSEQKENNNNSNKEEEQETQPIETSSSPQPQNEVDEKEEALRRLKERFNKDNKKQKQTNATVVSPDSGKKKKEGRSWGVSEKITAKDMKQLDLSKDKDITIDSIEEDSNIGKSEMEIQDEEGDDDEIDIDINKDNNNNNDNNDKKKSNSSGGWNFGFVGDLFERISGNKVLTDEDLEPVFEEMKKKLISKNVAHEVSNELCNSVMKTIVGKKLPSLTTTKTVVGNAIKDALLRILTPSKSIDILRQVTLSKEKNIPYTICFVGVNGVGKSTSLSKVAYYLKKKGFRVLVAACDTFRSGAVEQLKVHVKKLSIDIYEKGYSRDPAGLAQEAITYAKSNKYDVVLIDTAGRMQNNEPLMRSLTKLIALNQPNLVLFVGEALVGNDGVDQLLEFNRALTDYSNMQNPRVIDGIMLTKFDTIDDKVGAALSMVYKTGKPIIFVGTGQKYIHLKRLNVKDVVQALFS